MDEKNSKDATVTVTALSLGAFLLGEQPPAPAPEPGGEPSEPGEPEAAPDEENE